MLNNMRPELGTGKWDRSACRKFTVIPAFAEVVHDE